MLSGKFALRNRNSASSCRHSSLVQQPLTLNNCWFQRKRNTFYTDKNRNCVFLNLKQSIYSTASDLLIFAQVLLAAYVWPPISCLNLLRYRINPSVLALLALLSNQRHDRNTIRVRVSTAQVLIQPSITLLNVPSSSSCAFLVVQGVFITKFYVDSLSPHRSYMSNKLQSHTFYNSDIRRIP